MKLLVAGMIVFIATHLIPAMPRLRRALVVRLTEKGYLGLFALLSFAGLGLIVWGKTRAAYVEIWTPPAWGAAAAFALMLPALVCLTAKDLPSNLKRHTRHPMLWGVLLWAVAHLLSNGDLASLILFGGFALYAPFAMWSANRRGATLSSRRQPTSRDLLVLAIGLALYGVLVYLHPYLFGAPVTPVWP